MPPLREEDEDQVGKRLELRGEFLEVYAAADRGENLVSGTATEVVLDSETGEVVAVR